MPVAKTYSKLHTHIPSKSLQITSDFYIFSILCISFLFKANYKDVFTTIHGKVFWTNWDYYYATCLYLLDKQLNSSGTLHLSLLVLKHTCIAMIFEYYLWELWELLDILYFRTISTTVEMISLNEDLGIIVAVLIKEFWCLLNSCMPELLSVGSQQD